MAFVWDERRIEILRTLWPGGVSAREIADKIGAPSKSAVIGKAHRIGLPSHVNARGNGTEAFKSFRGRKGGLRLKAKAMARKAVVNPDKPNEPKLKAVPLPKPRTDLPPLIARVTFEQLQNDQCKFPVGDPREADFGFCGQPRVLGKPYCSDCCQRAYTVRETRVSRPSHAISTQSHAHKQGVST